MDSKQKAIEAVAKKSYYLVQPYKRARISWRKYLLKKRYYEFAEASLSLPEVINYFKEELNKCT